MGLGTSRRAAIGIVTTALASLAIASAAQAQVGTSFYPNGGSTFTSGSDGWFDQSKECILIVLPGTLCNVDNVYDGANGSPDRGRPPGSLRTDFQAIALALGTVRGTGRFESPAFTVTENDPASVHFRIDRKASIDALVNLGGTATTLVRMYDSTAGTATTVFEETLDESDAAWTEQVVAVPESLIVNGHRYAFRVITYFTGTLQALNGTASVNYDNIVMRVIDTPPVGV